VSPAAPAGSPRSPGTERASTAATPAPRTAPCSRDTVARPPSRMRRCLVVDAVSRQPVLRRFPPAAAAPSPLQDLLAGLGGRRGSRRSLSFHRSPKEALRAHGDRTLVRETFGVSFNERGAMRFTRAGAMISARSWPHADPITA